MPNIDERVVSMQFDNSEFDPRLKKSQKTFEEFEESLSFEKGSKALKNFEKQMDDFDTEGFSKKLGKLGESFSALETVAAGALLSIGQKLEQHLSRALNMTLTQGAAQGWSDYAEKVTSVQTIMAATAAQFKDTEVQITAVNDQLNELRSFADETSYSFKDMTNNIGKFTSQGVDLKTSVAAMEGISTWAALSGAGIAQAEHAMYNLSQALAVGYIQRLDWKSIDSANMSTLEFKQTAIDTAIELGTLKEVGEGVYETLSGKRGRAPALFQDLLTERWFTSNVLLKSLDRYGGFAQELLKYTNKTGDAVRDVMDWIDDYSTLVKAFGKDSKEVADYLSEFTPEEVAMLEKLGDKSYDLGRKAFRAGQETKTFAEALNYTKEAIATGWSQTWELIFGDYTEAKKFWTDVTDDLYEIFVKGGEIRNKVLTLWSKTFGREDFVATIDAIRNSVYAVSEVIDKAWRAVFPFWNNSEDLASMLLVVTRRLREWAEGFELTEEQAEAIREAVTLLGKSLRFVLRLAKSLYTMLAPTLRWTRNFLKLVIDLSRPLVRAASAAFDFGEEIDALQLGFLLLGAAVAYPIKLINRLMEWMRDMGNKTLPELEKDFSKWGENIKESWNKFLDIFRGAGSNITGAFALGMAEGWKAIGLVIADIFLGAISLVESILGIHSPSRVFMVIGGLVLEGLAIGFLVGWDKVAKAFAFIADKIKAFGATLNISFSEIWRRIKIWFAIAKDWILDAFSKVGEAVKKFGQFVKDWAPYVKQYAQALLLLATAISELRLAFGVGAFLSKAGTALKWLSDAVGDFTDALKREAAAKVLDEFGNTALKVGGALVMLAAAFWLFSKFPVDNMKQAGVALGAIAAGLTAIMGVLLLFSKVMVKMSASNATSITTKKGGIIGKLLGTVETTIFGARDARANLVSLAASMLVITFAMAVVIASIRKLAQTMAEFNLDWKGVLSYLGVILLAVLGLGAIAATMTRLAGKSTGRLIIAAVNILLLTKVIEKLTEVLTPFFNALGITFQAMWTFAEANKRFGQSTFERFIEELMTQYGGIIIGFAAVSLLVVAMIALLSGLGKAIGGIKLKVVLGILAIFGIFAVVVKATQKLASSVTDIWHLVGVMTAMTVFLAAVYALTAGASVLTRKASLTFFEDAPKMLIGIAAFMLVMALAVSTMPTLTVTDVLKFSLILLSISALLAVIAFLLTAADEISTGKIDAVGKTLWSITGLIAIIGGLAIAFDKLQIDATSVAMVGLVSAYALSLVIMVATMMKLGETDNLAKIPAILLSITGLIAVLGGLVIAFDKLGINSTAITQIGFLVGYAVVLGVLVMALDKSFKSGKEVGYFAAVIGTMMGAITTLGAMAYAIQQLGITQDDLNAVGNLIVFASLIMGVLYLMTKGLSEINAAALGKVLLVLVVGVLAFSAVVGVLIGAGMAMRAVLTSIADGVLYFINAILTLDGMWGTIFKNLLAFAGASLVLAVALVALSVAGVALGLVMTTIAVAVAIFAGAVITLSVAVLIFGVAIGVCAAAFVGAAVLINKYSFEIMSAITTLINAFTQEGIWAAIGAMAVFGLAIAVLGIGSITGAAGLLALTAAMWAFAASSWAWNMFLSMMEKFDWDKHGKKMMQLAGAIAVLGLSSLLLVPIISTIFIGISLVSIAASMLVAAITGAMLAMSALIITLVNNMQEIGMIIDLLHAKADIIADFMIKIAGGLLAVGGGLLLIGIGSVLTGIGLILMATAFTIFTATAVIAVIALLAFVWAMSMMKEDCPELYDRLLTIIDAIIGFLAISLETYNRLQPVIDRFFTAAVSIFESVADIIHFVWFDLLKPFFGWVKDAISFVWNDVLKPFVQWLKDTGNFLTEKVFKPIGEFFGTAFEKFKQFGEWFGGGISKGIESAKSGVKGALDKFGEFMVRVFHDGPLDFGSPSHVMEQYGVDAVQGFGNGWRKESKNVIDDIDDIQEKITNKVEEAKAKASLSKDGEVKVDGEVKADTSLVGTLKDVGSSISSIFADIKNGNKTIGEGLSELITVVKDKGGAFLGDKISGIKNKLLGEGGVLSEFSNLFKNPFEGTDFSDLFKGIGDKDDDSDPYKQIDLNNLGSMGDISSLTSGSGQGTINTYEFVQNNYSPKALSRIEIYRQTNRQFNNFRTREVLAR